MIFLIITTVIILVIKTLKIKLEIKQLKIQVPKINKKLTNNESEINLKIYIFKLVKIVQIDLKKIKSNKLKIKDIIKNENYKIKSNINIIQLINKEIFEIESMNLKIYEGLDDAALTAIGTGLISTFIGLIIKDKINNQNTQKFIVIPIYNKGNVLKIEFDGIIGIKSANIIYIIKLLLKKRRDEKNDRTSNRRSYVHSHE